ncbi:MAG: ABC transporter substrate-binding protein [Solobacterium sp.]|nr:ABC transporter substrate-binding protein [Solobacterium sp.]
MKKNITFVTKAGIAALALSLAACRGKMPFIPEAKKTGTNSTYAYLLDTTDLKKPELDLENAGGALKKVLDKGVLTVVTSPDLPPYEWVDEEGKVRGTEMMLAKYIADCLEVDLEVSQTAFTGTFAALDAGEADCAFAGYGWTKDREATYELTSGFSGEGNDAVMYCTVVAAAEKADQYTAIENLSDARAAVQEGTLQDMFCGEQKNVFGEVIRTGTLDEAIQGLESGDYDVVVLDGTTAENYGKKSDGKIVLTGIRLDISSYEDKAGTVGLCTKGETSLLEVLNACIKTAAENGYYSSWYEQEKNRAVWKTEFPEPTEETEGTEGSEEGEGSQETENSGDTEG